MPSFQSPVPISGRPCAPSGEAAVERRARSARRATPLARPSVGLEVARRARPARSGRPFEERHALVEDAAIAGRLDVVRGDVGSQTRSSEMRVRTPWPAGGSHQCWTSPSTNCRAAARRRCSRVSSGRATASAMHVLELVAEAVGAARLVERRARPDAAGQRLIEQPAVQHDVHRAVRRLHLDGAEQRRPSSRVDLAQHGVEIGVAVARDQRRAPRRRRRPGRGRRRSRSRRPAASSTVRLQRARRDRGRRRPRRDSGARAASAAGAVERAVAAEELARGRRSSAVCRPPRSAKATRAPNAAFQGLRANSAPVAAIDLGRRRTAPTRRATTPSTHST